LQTRYVVDTTVLVSWLLDPNKLTGKIVRSLELELFTPYKTVSELSKHSYDWSRRRPGLDLEEFTDAIRSFVQIITLLPDSPEMREARTIMGPIDPDDSEFVALALITKAPIWTHDKHFERQRRIHIVDSRDILESSQELPALWETLKDEWSKRRTVSHRDRPET
jgi:predicted nucleic acid-binding protein